MSDSYGYDNDKIMEIVDGLMFRVVELERQLHTLQQQNGILPVVSEPLPVQTVTIRSQDDIPKPIDRIRPARVITNGDSSKDKKVCTTILIRGPNQGKECSRQVVKGLDTCAYHTNAKPRARNNCKICGVETYSSTGVCSTNCRSSYMKTSREKQMVIAQSTTSTTTTTTTTTTTPTEQAVVETGVAVVNNDPINGDSDEKTME